MFLTTLFIPNDIAILSLYLLYLFILSYAIGTLIGNYYHFEKYNFFLKINIGFLLLFGLNFFFYSFFMLFNISQDVMIIFEKIKDFFILFFLIFSFKNWINFNQKYNFFFFKKTIITFLSIIIIFVTFYFSEKNLEFFNPSQSLDVSYPFYQYYYNDISLQIQIYEVSNSIFLNYFLVFLFSYLIYFLTKGVIGQNNKNYLFSEILILSISLLFTFLINVFSTLSEYYFVIYLFIFAIFLLYEKENYKSKNNIFNQIILFSIFLSFSSTNWGIFYFISFSFSLIFYLLYKEENIYSVFSLSLVLIFIQFFLYIYNISIFYGLLFFIIGLLIFYYPVASLFKWERSTELLNFEENLKKNQKNFIFAFLIFIFALNLFFIFSDANGYFDKMGNLLYFDTFSNASYSLNLTISILFFTFIVLTTFYFFFYLIFYKKFKDKENSFSYFFSIIFILFFNPFTIVTFSIIFDLSLNYDIYYLLFFLFIIFFTLNFVKNLNKKSRV
ncbi:MAG: hypothetical protein HPAVJP_5860 [Candidatus Hepatoplasma vulgare]|nr:MAG: hypothetical protein HPAVJP_5860 [Candidatus Hepatoplasma sp.]